jgi:aspartate aminotransferase
MLPQTPQVSSRGRRMPASPVRKLMPIADAAKRRGIHVYHLNIGQPDLETPAVMRRQLARLQEVIAYTPSGGTPDYLAALRTYYGRLGFPLRLDQVIATTGGSEALLFALLACADDGDEALVVEPFYTNYKAFAVMAGVRLVALTSRGEDGFHLPPREVWERAITPRTRLVLLCNPNNPTGTVYDREELEEVARLCRERGLFLVCDEVYREFVYDGRVATSGLALAGYEDLVVVADSLSKRYSACGLRLGCLVTRNPGIYQAALRLAQGRLAPPALAQLMAVGLTELGEDYYASVVREYQARRDLLYAGVSAIPDVFLRKPEGAFYFVARLPVDDGESFARFMLEEFSLDGATVMVAPAQGFYATPGLGRNEVRIAYVLEQDDLKAAVRILEAGIAAYREAHADAPGEAAAEAAIAATEPVAVPDFHIPVE